MPKIFEGRLEVKLRSTKGFISCMELHGFTVRSLAMKVGCAPSTIAHLRTGRRGGSCNPHTARQIAKALDLPIEMLFEPRLSNVARDVDRSKGSRWAA